MPRKVHISKGTIFRQKHGFMTFCGPLAGHKPPVFNSMCSKTILFKQQNDSQH